MNEKLVKLYRFSNSWTGTIIIVLLVIFFFAQAFVIPSGSMKNTFHEGDHLLVKKYVYGIPIPHLPWLEIPLLPDFAGNGHLIGGDKPQRGDIVVFRYPHNPQIHYVKRCVALGGDKVMLKGDKFYIRPFEGDEFIKSNYKPDQVVSIADELWVVNPYKDDHRGIRYDYRARDEAHLPVPTYDFGPIVVPADNFFMVGDNRDHSNDSRFWGSVEYKYIVGKPWFIYFSWESRSYDEVARRGAFLADYEALEKVCGDADLLSLECEQKWNKQRYKIRWERVGKGVEALEDRL